MLRDLQESYAALTQSQKRIAEAIVDDPEFVAFATIDKFASRLGVASSTIVRFAYRLGLEGYPDLQFHVRELVKTRMRPTSEEMLDDDVYWDCRYITTSSTFVARSPTLIPSRSVRRWNW